MRAGPRDDVLDAGHAALLGHRLLNSVSVVTGALATLRDGNPVPADQYARLDEQVEANLAAITEIARSLVHGEVARGRPTEFCTQCYGRGEVRIQGSTRACTCVSWARIVESNARQTTEREPWPPRPRSEAPSASEGATFSRSRESTRR
jgi:hypothetical protein